MRKQILMLLALLVSTLALAQSPQGFNYQTVVRDSNGNLLANQTVSFQIEILEDSVTGTVAYLETHNTITTNAQGVITLVIGSGTTSDTFANINWGNNTYFLEISIDTSGGTNYATIGTSELVSVPYALNASKVEQLNGGSNGQILSTDGSGTVSWIDSVDSLNSTFSQLSSGLSTFNLEVIGDTGDIFTRLTLIDVLDEYVYGYNDDTDDFLVINVSDPYNPQVEAQLATGITIGFSSAKSAGVIVGNYCYLYSQDGFLAIVNITDPSQPALVSNTTAIDADVEAIASDGNYLYLVDDSVDKAFTVVDISSPESPVILPNTVSGLNMDSNNASMVINNGYAYVMSNETDNIDIIDVTDPLNPSLVLSSNLFGYYLTDIIAEGDYLYVLDEDESLLKIFNISNPVSPASIGTLSIGGTPQSLVKSGDYVYIVDSESDDLKVVDVSDPSTPSLASDIGFQRGAFGVRVQGSYAYAQNQVRSDNSLKVVNLFNSTTLGVAYDGTLQTVQDRDEQNLTGASLSGTVLTIEIENGDATTVNLSSLADDMGNHTATQNIQTNSNWISNDGDGEGVFVDASGNVGVNTATPGVSFQVGENGDGTESRANAWNTFSDRRWKTDFQVIENAVEKIQAVNGYYYKWKDKPDTSTQVGVIAQEIEAVLPEVVSTDSKGYKSVDYSKLTALLIEGMKEQQQQIQALQTKNSDLETKNDQIESRLSKIERHLEITVKLSSVTKN
ncbi:tail fiber domain-containing protein [Aquimarina sp. MMG016]|uniref:tail fiber domain-containing protein n=1 Tax=Aquimarina sp. MMG016 TaxID=2822690 RepID=UPI001B3A6C08|nr:tail fiber domain-containing protein [Aquimarina sp. MMG016]MBQ4820679.1 tail fiber domain-containing protein [Aquimarina sp. MMG016]